MVNRIVLVGRLTRDPESSYTTSGLAIAKFGIAVDRISKNKETGEKETDFINVVCFQRTAEFVTQYLTKGRLVAVDGRLQIRSWESPQDGTKRTAAEVIAESVQGLDRAKDAEGGAPRPEGGYNATPKAVPPPPAISDADQTDPFADE